MFSCVLSFNNQVVISWAESLERSHYYYPLGDNSELSLTYLLINGW
jgi:hypothetical protein